MTRKALFAAALATVLIGAFPHRASAQVTSAITVGSCGAQSYATGSPAPITILGNGNVCVNATATASPTYYSNFNPDSSPLTVTSTATSMVSSRASRAAVTIENEQAVAMRCGPVNTVTFAGTGSTTGGVLIPGVIGANWTWTNMTSAIWCITSSTSTTASVSETY